MTTQPLLYEKTDGIARITLNRPETMNALDEEMATALREVLSDVKDDPDSRVVVLTGTGRGFSAGGDVAAFRDNIEQAPGFLRAMILQLHAAISYLLTMDKPVIAGINGVTAGAGMGLCMAADLAIAAESAVFTMAYTAIGASPDGSSTYFLPRLVGTRRAMEMALTNRKLDAAEALDWGLINKVVPDDALTEELDKLAKRLQAGPTLAYATTRKLIRQSLHTSMATQLEHEGDGIIAMTKTDDFREGVTAFMEKRRADFKGK